MTQPGSPTTHTRSNVLYGAAVVAMIAASVTEAWWLLFVAGGLTALGIALVVPAIVEEVPRLRREARVQKELWRDRRPVVIDEAVLRVDPRAIVRRVSKIGRLMAVATTGVTGIICTQVFVDPDVSPLEQLIIVAFAAGVAAWAIGVARSVLIVTDDVLIVRNSLLGTKAARWPEVTAIEPTHQGLSFVLIDGRRAIANATAKTGLVFLKPRFDGPLLADLRARLRAP